MTLRQKCNDELFELYDSDIVLRLRNVKNLSDTRKILAKFKQYLNQFPPSSEIAKTFLAPFADRKPRTLYRYAQMIKAFMKWYGEPMNDFHVKVPKCLLLPGFLRIFFPTKFGSMMYTRDAASNNAASFLADVNQEGLDNIVDGNLKAYAPWLELYPDRIFWGTDLASLWHYEEAVTDVVIRISRQFIGRLPADIQEKYAYQNAQRVFGRFLSSNPWNLFEYCCHTVALMSKFEYK